SATSPAVITPPACGAPTAVVPLGVYGCTPKPVPSIPSDSTRNAAEKVCATGSRFVAPYASQSVPSGARTFNTASEPEAGRMFAGAWNCTVRAGFPQPAPEVTVHVGSVAAAKNTGRENMS